MTSVVSRKASAHSKFFSLKSLQTQSLRKRRRMARRSARKRSFDATQIGRRLMRWFLPLPVVQIVSFLPGFCPLACIKTLRRRKISVFRQCLNLGIECGWNRQMGVATRQQTVPVTTPAWTLRAWRRTRTPAGMRKTRRRMMGTQREGDAESYLPLPQLILSLIF